MIIGTLKLLPSLACKADSINSFNAAIYLSFGRYLATLAYEAVLMKFTAPVNVRTLCLVQYILTLAKWHGCTLALTRSVNIVFAALSALVFYRLLRLLNAVQTSTAKNNIMFIALMSYLLPISFFFHFMFYTDSGSTFFVLTAYYNALSGRRFISSIVRSSSLAY